MYLGTLATKDDVINFVYEMSPHIRKVKVKDCTSNSETDYDVLITIKVSWLYGLFFKEAFHAFIAPKIQERKILGLEYKIVITSLFA